MREIVDETFSADSAVFMFNEGSVVWVCFKPSTTVDADVCAIARIAAKQFLNTLNPAGRWEGKIDSGGKILESPINLNQS